MSDDILARLLAGIPRDKSNPFAPTEQFVAKDEIVMHAYNEIVRLRDRVAFLERPVTEDELLAFALKSALAAALEFRMRAAK